ncbi:MAG: TolC family protein [Planctomycetes bacterium]|nr:TolC family protein [Planctomycetota bacterium]MCB9888498.1 TolC family protein [Planctomycetota bacterium]
MSAVAGRGLVWVGVVLLVAAALAGQDTKFKFTEPKDIPIPTEKGGGRVVDLSLEDARRMADRQNVDLSALRLTPQQTLLDIQFAEAFYDSQAYAEGGYASSKDPSTSPFSPAITREIYDAKIGWRKRFYSGGLFDLSFFGQNLDQSTSFSGFPTRLRSEGFLATYTQPLWRAAWWAYGEADVRKAQASAAASKHTVAQSEQDTLLAVTRAYWELVFARENYRVQFQSLELANEQLRITRARIAVKDLAPRDAVADEAEVARFNEALITAENEIRQREDDLRALIFSQQQGDIWGVVLRPSSPIPSTLDAAKLDWREVAEVALVQRPELGNLRAAVEAARQDLVAAEGEFNPQLDLVGSYNSSTATTSTFSSAWDDVHNLRYPDWSVRLLFSYPLGNRAARSRRDRAQLGLEAASRRVVAREIKVRTEVRQAVRNLKTLTESIRASRESVRLAENDLDTARHKLRVGSLTFFDVAQRNQQLQLARSRQLRNQLDFRIAEAVLLHAQGKLFPPAPEPEAPK